MPFSLVLHERKMTPDCTHEVRKENSMKSRWSNWNGFFIGAALLVLFSAGLQAQNLVLGGDMTSEADWNIYYYNPDQQPSYEFNYTDDTLRFGHGGSLHLVQGESGGQLLFWQTVTLIAGETYRATAAIRELNYQPGPAGGGAWYQMYITPEVPDPDAGEFNPGAIHFFDISGYVPGEFPVEFDGLWESLNMTVSAPTAPYYTVPGTPGEAVDVTFGIKFGQYWATYEGTAFELLVDDVGLFPVKSAVNLDADMESEADWNIYNYNADMQPTYEFNYTDDTLRFGHGGNLHIVQGETGGQLLLWQTVTLVAGETYRATGAIRELNYQPGPAGGGAWYQMYIDPSVPDPDAGEYNPGAVHFFDISGFVPGEFPIEFDNLWESLNMTVSAPTAPYYTAPGTPGEEVEVTFGIKFGQYWATYEGTAFELLVDDVYLFPMTEAGKTAVDERETPDQPADFALAQNYPNPFNPATKIDYTLKSDGRVRLTVFDLKGREVATLADGLKPAGRHSVIWDAKNLKSGVYFCKLQADGTTITRKMLLVK